MKKLLLNHLVGVLLLLLSVTTVSAQTLLDSFGDGNFTASPAWGGNTTLWGVQVNSDAAAGATGSNTLRQNSGATTGTDYLSTQIATWSTSQEWGFWVGRRAQAYTLANQMYIWLYANEATLNNATVDGYRIAIGDDSGSPDKIRLEYIVNGAVSATVITSTGGITNAITDIGFLVRVTRSSAGAWQIFTSALPTANGTGAIATAIPNSTNANVSQGTATNNTLVPAANGYFGVAALHSNGGNAIVTNEIDQIYFTVPTPEIDIRGNSTSITSGDNSPSTGDFTDFGSTSVSSGSVVNTFFIHNTGTASLTVGAISFSGAGAADYSVTSAPTSPLNGGAFTSFNVTFDPSATGTRDAVISIVNNDSNENPYTFSLTGTGLADIAEPDWVNLQSPATQTIAEGNTFPVYAQVYEPALTDSAGQGADVLAWIGYSSANTDPSGGGWTWVPASYFGDFGNNDEYSLAFGSGIAPGTYYYASRFQIGTGPYVYGGTGGIWNFDSGVLTVNSNVVDFCNVQHPATGSIAQGNSLTVYAQVYEPGVTEAAGQGAGISGWIGYSSANTNPNTGGWTWVAATFNVQSGNNDEYSAAIGSSLVPGTYYYASRFQKAGSSEYRYGGTGGFWNNDSGVLTVSTPQEINLQGNSANIVSGDVTPSAADHTDFGSTVLGTPIVRTFTIQNTGGVNLILDLPAVVLNETDSFSITQQPTSPVAPGGSTTFQVTYTPTATGADTNTVLIGSNDTNEGIYTFAIQGTASIDAPVAVAANPVGTTSFTANWNAVPGAASYRLDVSSDPAFEGPYTSLVAWNFPNNPDDAVADGGIVANASRTITVGGGVTTLVFSPAGATTNSANAINWQNGNLTKYWEVQLTTTGYYATRISSKQRGSNTAPRDFKLQYKIGAAGTYTDVPGTAITVANNFTSGVLTNVALPSACDNQPLVYLRWIMTSDIAVNGTPVVTGGSANIDDILVEGRLGTMIAPYDNLNVGNVTSYNVNTNIVANTTYYYRVRAVSGGTSANSNAITVTTDPVSVTWSAGAWSNVTGPDADIEAVLVDAYNSGESEGEFSAKKLTINTGGSLTIAEGTNITVVNEVINNLTEAALVIENNANLIQVGDVNNTGSATVARNSNALMRLDYTLWSSPVDAQNLLDFSPATTTNRFYVYNPGTNLYNTVVPSTTDFAEGTGYLIRMPNNHPTTPTVWNGSFTGTPRNGNVAIAVANNTYNAVGNPYPSTIDADLFITQNGLTEALYFWRKTNNDLTTSYATYTLAGGAGTSANAGDPNSIVPNGIIQVGQGFIARSTSTTLSFNNQMRVADNAGQFFRTSATERNRIWVNLTNADGVFSQTMISYMTGATQGVDPAIDGLYFNDSQLALTSLIGTTEYAIQGRALPFTGTDVVPMGFKVLAAGNYTIGLDHMDGLFLDPSQPIFLRDNLTNSEHDLRLGNYTFASEAGVFNGRFEIIYQTTLGTAAPIFAAGQVIVYKQAQDLVINTGNAKMASVKVYDLRGRLLAEKQNINASETRIFAGHTNQVLVVKVLSDDNKEVTKKVVH